MTVNAKARKGKVKQPLRGRSKDSAKADAITLAARRLFLRHGYDGVSIEAIAAAATVSKVTVYSHFKDKEDLFRSIVVTIAREHSPSQPAEIDSENAFVCALEAHGQHLVSILSSDDVHRFHQLIVSHPRGLGSLKRIIYENGPAKMWRDLTELLAEGKARGYHSAPDPERAADQLLSMWKGMAFVRMEMGVSGPPTLQEARENISAATNLFLRAWPGKTKAKTKTK